MSGKLLIKELYLTNFRSWASGKFEFLPGITLVAGSNGAGKSTIGMAVQYAVNGKVPKLTKDDLVMRGAVGNLRVKLVCEKDGTPLTISRSLNRANITFGDTKGSVREAAFMADMKQSVAYSFLSQNVASFVDMPEFKRKELLDSLIPEVTMLRSVCAPAVKNLVKKYFQKRYSVQTNLSAAEGVVRDMDISIRSARAALETEREKQAAILQAQKEALPFSEEMYNIKVMALEDHNKSLIEFKKYIEAANRWITVAQVGNREISSAKERQQYLEGELIKLNGYLQSFQHQPESKQATCPDCKTTLICKACGSVQKANVSQKFVDNVIESTKETIAKTEESLHTTLEYIQRETWVDVEAINATQASLNKAINDVKVIEAKTQQLISEINQYTTKLNNIRYAEKLGKNMYSLEGMENHIRDLQNRRAALQAQLERKAKTYGVMENLEQKMTRAGEIMYNTLPMLYFDQFLNKLTYACNYLLKPISGFTIAMGASADGITIYVNGSKLSQLSSGEMQRVRVAVTLAFSLLAVRTDTLFLDEMFDTALDTDGLDALATLLRGPVSRFYEKIVVITHNAGLMAALSPDRIITVDKASGSTLCQLT